MPYLILQIYEYLSNLTFLHVGEIIGIKIKSKEVLSAVRDYLMELVSALEGRLAYRVEDIKDD